MNKRQTVLFVVVSIVSFSLHGQRQNRIGYVDMDYILRNIPEYKEAKAQLDLKVEEWQKEMRIKKDGIKKVKENLRNERPLLTQDLIKQFLEEIAYRESELSNYQEKVFGPQGELETRQQKIIIPIQDQVFNAVHEIGVEREYDFIFENSSDALMLFSANRHDISDQVLSRINRNSNLEKHGIKERNSKFGTDDDKRYKSVTQDRLDTKNRQKKEERKNRTAETQSKREAQQWTPDSLIEARRHERQSRLDSIKRARKSLKKNLRTGRE